MSDPGATYYDRPVLKEPVWIWAVPAYLYAGGAAGAAATLGAAAQLLARERSARLIRGCRVIGAAGTSVGAALLIHDLGRPERFLNMLRVFRPTSAMSVGSWVLAASGSLGAASLLPSSAGNVAGLAAGVTGIPLAGYAAVLLADTSVPLWQQARRSLPPLFVASSMASAASLLDGIDLDPYERAIVHRIGIIAKGADLAAMAAVDRDARRVERVARPLDEGVGGALWRAAKALTTASLAVSLIGGRGRTGRLVGAALGTAGAIALRFAVFHAGKASARDPRATFESQRA